MILQAHGSWIDTSRFHPWKQCSHLESTPWKFNIAPENGWLEDEFPFGIPYFQGLC